MAGSTSPGAGEGRTSPAPGAAPGTPPVVEGGRTDHARPRASATETTAAQTSAPQTSAPQTPVTERPSRLIIGISGASGAVLGIRALQLLRERGGVETHLVISHGARTSIKEETGYSAAEVAELADVVYPANDLGAAIASGSFVTDGMLVAPCSIKTLSGIANCFSDTLLVRAADVSLKERRRLVLLVRETPLHAGHLRLMTEATTAGAVIMPPVPAYYTRPARVLDLVDHTVVRALDLLGLSGLAMRRWSGRGTFSDRPDEPPGSEGSDEPRGRAELRGLAEPQRSAEPRGSERTEQRTEER